MCPSILALFSQETRHVTTCQTCQNSQEIDTFHFFLEWQFVKDQLSSVSLNSLDKADIAGVVLIYYQGLEN